ncbi:uncharacterized protein [Phyllobates terribilis]|uniref:uncharacterized protein isoform X2 n=1 Tax=Phyllobates terribilis TaxID=111132 RepID=UPI003CCB2403
MEEETLKKFEKIKDTMEAVMEPRTDCTRSNKAHKVGIIADFLAENTFGWLHAALSSHHFSGIIKKMEFINTSDKDTKKILKMMSSCTFYISICSGYNQETFPAMRRRLGFLFGRENVILIIHNLEDNSEREKERILRENRDCIRWKENVILFSKKELSFNYLNRLVNDHPQRSMRKKKKGSQSLGRKSTRDQISSDRHHQEPQNTGHRDNKGEQKMSATLPVIRNDTRKVRGSERKSVFNLFGSNSTGRRSTRKLISSDRHHQEPQNTRYGDSNGDTVEHFSQSEEIKPHWVGIFSRSTERDYSWVVKKLRSEEFNSLVLNVKSCFIYNNQNFQEFIEDINQCTVGILYHSKNRGRVNITNVTDSLYDEELETLHMILGKRNVLVVIDDLEDSDGYRKKGILQEQRSIVERAADLLLVSHNDKMDPWLLGKKTDQIKSFLRDAGSAVASSV